jgi:hypothetical protein
MSSFAFPNAGEGGRPKGGRKRLEPSGAVTSEVENITSKIAAIRRSPSIFSSSLPMVFDRKKSPPDFHLAGILLFSYC